MGKIAENDIDKINMGEYIEVSIELENEVGEASNHLEKLRNEIDCLDISEEIWSYSKELLQEISYHYWSEYHKMIPIPKIIFIDGSIEIRWETDRFKLIISITDYIDDIVIFLKDKRGSLIRGGVHKERIVDSVIFWIKQFQTS